MRTERTRVWITRVWVLILLIAVAGCDWRWSDIPYRGTQPPGQTVAATSPMTAPVVAVVAAGGTDELSWFGAALQPPRLLPAAAVRYRGGVRLVAYTGEAPVRAVRLGGESLVVEDTEQVDDWTWISLDEESRATVEEIAREPATGPAAWVATITRRGEPALFGMPVTAGAFACPIRCPMGSLVFDRNGALIGAIGDGFRLRSMVGAVVAAREVTTATP